MRQPPRTYFLAAGTAPPYPERLATPQPGPKGVTVDDIDEQSPITDLVSLALAGDHPSWDELVTRYTPLVLSVVRRHRLQGAEAEDAVQTVWLRLVEHLGDLREPRALPGWIVTTARHECLRLIKLRQTVLPTDLTDRPLVDPSGVPDPAADLLEGERHEALLAALAELPERQRALLLLLITDPPIPYEAISRQLDIPIGSIGPTRARALARIRRHPAVSALIVA